MALSEKDEHDLCEFLEGRLSHVKLNTVEVQELDSAQAANRSIVGSLKENKQRSTWFMSFLDFVVFLVSDLLLPGINWVLGLFGLAIVSLEGVPVQGFNNETKRKFDKMEKYCDNFDEENRMKRCKSNYKDDDEHENYDFAVYKKLPDSDRSKAIAVFQAKLWNLEPDMDFMGKEAVQVQVLEAEDYNMSLHDNKMNAKNMPVGNEEDGVFQMLDNFDINMIAGVEGTPNILNDVESEVINKKVITLSDSFDNECEEMREAPSMDGACDGFIVGDVARENEEGSDDSVINHVKRPDTEEYVISASIAPNLELIVDNKLIMDPVDSSGVKRSQSDEQFPSKPLDIIFGTSGRVEAEVNFEENLDKEVVVVWLESSQSIVLSKRPDNDSHSFINKVQIKEQKGLEGIAVDELIVTEICDSDKSPEDHRNTTERIVLEVVNEILCEVSGIATTEEIRDDTLYQCATSVTIEELKDADRDLRVREDEQVLIEQITTKCEDDISGHCAEYFNGGITTDLKDEEKNNCRYVHEYVDEIQGKVITNEESAPIIKSESDFSLNVDEVNDELTGNILNGSLLDIVVSKGIKASVFFDSSACIETRDVQLNVDVKLDSEVKDDLDDGTEHTEKLDLPISAKQVKKVNFLQENVLLGNDEKATTGVSKAAIETVTLDREKVSFRKYEVESQPNTLHHEEGMETFATVGGGDEFDETECQLPMIEGRRDGVGEPIKEKNRKGSWGNVNKKKKKKRMF